MSNRILQSRHSVFLKKIFGIRGPPRSDAKLQDDYCYDAKISNLSPLEDDDNDDESYAVLRAIYKLCYFHLPKKSSIRKIFNGNQLVFRMIKKSNADLRAARLLVIAHLVSFCNTMAITLTHSIYLAKYLIQWISLLL